MMLPDGVDCKECLMDKETTGVTDINSRLTNIGFNPSPPILTWFRVERSLGER